MSGLRPDRWLGDVFGFAAYATDASGSAPGEDERSLTYAKIDVADIAAVDRLTSIGYRFVDVNVTLERAGTPALDVDTSAVRLASAEDGVALVELAGRCFRFSRFHLDPLLPDELADRVKREWITSYVEGRRGVELLAAFDGGRPVGFLAVLETDEACVIDLVGVAPEVQGRGFGRALVAAFVERHAAHGRELRVGTQLANVPSIRLYESLGFSIVGAAFVLHLHRRA